MKSESQVAQSCPTLCDPVDCSPPGSSVHGILQARILEWVAISFSRGSSRPRVKPASSELPALAGGLFTTTITWEALTQLCVCVCVCVLVAQSCPFLCNPMDCSPPGSSIHGILQARILKWVAISFSRGSSQPRDQTQVSRIAGRRFNL